MHDENGDAEDLEGVLGSIRHAGSNDDITVFDIVDEVGNRAFGPLLLAPAVVIVSPLSAIPGLSSFGGILIALIAVQMVIGRKTVWLPSFLGRRSVERGRLERAIDRLQKPARFIDRFIRPRMTYLTRKPLSLLPALACLAIGLTIPFFELVPMSASLMGFVVCLFGLALVARDGLLVILGFCAAASIALLAVTVFSGIEGQL